MATIEIRIGGVDHTGYVVYDRTTFTSVADGQAGTATVVLDDTEHDFTAASFTSGDTLRLFIDGTCEWDGWVINISRTWPFEFDDTTDHTSVPRLWVLEGYDRNVLFEKRIMYNVADPTSTAGFRIWPEDTPDRQAILYGLENYVDLTGDGLDAVSGIKQVGSPGPYEEFTLGFNSAPMQMLFEDCARMTGGVYYIDPDRVIRYNDDRTVTSPFNLSDNPGAGEVGYREFDAGLDFNQAANEAIVLGAGYGSPNPVGVKYTDASSVATYGLWQWGDIFVGAYLVDTVRKRARTYVEGSPNHHRGHNDPVPVVRCTVFEPGLRVGQVAKFTADAFGYSENLPIRNMNISFPTPTSVRYDLQLTLKIDTPFGAPDPLPGLAWPPLDRPDPIGGFPPPPEPNDLPGAGYLIDHFDAPRNVYIVGETMFVSTDTELTQTVALPDFEAGDYAYVALTATSPSLNADILTGSAFPDDWTLHYESGAGWASGRYMLLAADSPTTIDIHFAGGGGADNPNPLYVYIAIIRGAGAVEPASNYGAQPPLNSDYALTIATEHSNDGAVTGVSTSGWHIRWATGSSFGIGAAMRYDADGTQVAPSWLPDTDYSHTLAFVVADIEDILLRTPGPDVTGAPWDGGNVWHKTYSVLNDGTEQTALVEDSNIYDPTSSGALRIQTFDTFTQLINEDPDYVFLNPSNQDGLPDQHYPWSGFSTAWWSGGENSDHADLLIKWRYTGGAPISEALSIELWQVSIPLSGATPEDVWTSYTQFLIQDTEQQILTFEGEFTNVAWPGAGLTYPGQAYFNPSGGPSFDQDVWYWTRVQFGAPPGVLGWPYDLTQGYNPYELDNTGWNLSRMKTWVYGEPEPSTGESNGFFWYWNNGSFAPTPPGPGTVPGSDIAATTDGGWDIALPQAWNTNVDPDDSSTYDRAEHHNRLQLRVVGSTSGAGRYEIDGIWQYNTDLDAGGVALPTLQLSSGHFQDGVVVMLSGDYSFDGITYTSGDQSIGRVYSASTSYVPGSLVVYHEGVRLRAGIDYIELDPEAGTFLIISGVAFGSDQSGSDGVADSSTQFSALSASFSGSDVGTTIVIDGSLYTIATVVDSNTVTISGGTITGSSLTWSLPSSGYDTATVGSIDLSQGLTLEYQAATADPLNDAVAAGSAVTEVRPREPMLAHGWGTDQDGYNFVFAAASLALQRATNNEHTQFVGTPRNTPVTMRENSGVTSGNPTLADIAAAWLTWGEVLTYGTYTWAEFDELLTEGRGAILLGTYSLLPASRKHGNPSTRATFALYINEQMPDGSYWGVDPLYPYPQTYSAADLQAFAVGYQTSGKVDAGFTEVT